MVRRPIEPVGESGPGGTVYVRTSTVELGEAPDDEPLAPASEMVTVLACDELPEAESVIVLTSEELPEPDPGTMTVRD